MENLFEKSAIGNTLTKSPVSLKLDSDAKKVFEEALQAHMGFGQTKQEALMTILSLAKESRVEGGRVASVKEVESAMDSLTMRINFLLAEGKEERAGLADQLEKASQERAELEAKMAEMQKELEATQQALTKEKLVSDQVAELRKQVSSMQKKADAYDSLKAEADELKLKLATTEAALAKSEAELAKKEAEMQKAIMDQHMVSMQELADLKAELALLKK